MLYGFICGGFCGIIPRMIGLLSIPDVALLAGVFLATLFAVPLAIRLAERIGMIDLPGGRKRHEKAVPPIGGLVVFPIFMIAAFYFGLPPHGEWFLMALFLLVATGAMDDRFGLRARVRFVVQIAAAIMIAIPGKMVVTNLGNMFGPGAFQLGIAAIPFAITAAVLLINAINLIDGLDGLAGGYGVIVLGWMAVCATVAGAGGDLMLLLLLICALCGFLVYNMRHPWRSQASVFLGDCGSLALGLSLAWFALRLGATGDLPPILPPISIAWLLALPIFDTCGQFARRVSQGRHPFDADHHHFHHHFIYAGFTPGQATATILGIAFLNGVIGVGGYLVGVPEYVLAYIWIASLLTHIYMSMRPHRFRRIVSFLRGQAVKE